MLKTEYSSYLWHSLKSVLEVHWTFSLRSAIEDILGIQFQLRPLCSNIKRQGIIDEKQGEARLKVAELIYYFSMLYQALQKAKIFGEDSSNKRSLLKIKLLLLWDCGRKEWGGEWLTL